MKTAIIYKSLTGNTKLLAETIREVLGEENVYCGEPAEVEADLYFIGSWTDKGSCCEEISQYLGTLNSKKIAYFGTAGFGGSKEYYEMLMQRIKEGIPASNEIAGSFFCQGKMPESVKNRYIMMQKQNPEEPGWSEMLHNYEEALPHPDKKDLENLRDWAKGIRNT